MKKLLPALAILSGLSVGSVQAEPTGAVAVFTGLDKITARITRLEVNIGERVRFGSLEVKADTCSKRPPEETPETTAFVEVFDIGRQLVEAPAEGGLRTEPAAEQEPDRIFSGWMFASSPGLNAVEHPVYDVWLIDCKMAAPSTVSPSE